MGLRINKSVSLLPCPDDILFIGEQCYKILIKGEIKMKNIIIGSFICMLLIASAVPAVESLSENIIQIPSQNIHYSSSEEWNEMQKIYDPNLYEVEAFGYSLAIDGDTALVGAILDKGDSNYTGSVYVYVRSGVTWNIQTKLHADTAGSMLFGNDVALEGDTALVGACEDYYNGIDAGSVFVFVRNGTTWTQQAKLHASDEHGYDNFGSSVSLSGDSALIGAHSNDGDFIGSAYVFTRTGTAWTEEAKLLPSGGSSENLFGNSVDIDGDTALIGAVRDNNFTGSAYVFIRSGTIWTQQQRLSAADGVPYDVFGHSVALSGDTALIGKPGYQYMPIMGSGYVFTRNGVNWTEQMVLHSSDGYPGDLFGYCVDIDGDTNIIGAYYHLNDVGSSGSAYVFNRTGTTWMEEAKLIASDGTNMDTFGNSVALDNNTIFIGNMFDTVYGYNTGSAYIFMKGIPPELDLSVRGGLGITVTIKNNGTTIANDVEWYLDVQGGLLGRITETMNGIIDVPAGQSKSFSTGLFFGFGPITITTKVAEEEQTTTGTQFVIFSILKK